MVLKYIRGSPASCKMICFMALLRSFGVCVLITAVPKVSHPWITLMGRFVSCKLLTGCKVTRGKVLLGFSRAALCESVEFLTRAAAALFAVNRQCNLLPGAAAPEVASPG